MGTEETHGLGYRQVDDDPNVAVLLDTMDATSAWEATRALRVWERDQLGIAPGQRLLDVGCGLGDAALALAVSLGPDGELVGVDASAQMIEVAGVRAAGAECRVRFDVGDALALDEPDGCFDFVRTERTLQWLPDPQAAVRELARVVRAGGLVSMIDSDWSTLSLHVGDRDLEERVSAALRHERRRPSNVGSRLGDLAQNVGLALVAQTSTTQSWRSWSPDETPAPPGCFSMTSLADDLIDAGQLQPGEKDRFVATIHQAAREGRFSMELTMHAAVARA